MVGCIKFKKKSIKLFKGRKAVFCPYFIINVNNYQEQKEFFLEM